MTSVFRIPLIMAYFFVLLGCSTQGCGTKTYDGIEGYSVMGDANYLGDYAEHAEWRTSKDLYLDVSPEGYWFLLDPNRLDDEFDGNWQLTNSHLVVPKGTTVTLREAIYNTEGNIHWVHIFAMVQSLSEKSVLMDRISDKKGFVNESGQTDTTRWRYRGPYDDCLEPIDKD